MFARVLETARGILNRSSSVQSKPEDITETLSTNYEAEPDTKVEMVTTRSGTGTETPRSSARKGRGKRQLDAQDTPTLNKRRRQSTVKRTAGDGQERDRASEHEESPILDTIAVAVPIRSKSEDQAPVNERESPSKRRTSPKDVVSRQSTPVYAPKPSTTEPSRQNEFESDGNTDGVGVNASLSAEAEIKDHSPSKFDHGAKAQVTQNTRKKRYLPASPPEDALVAESRLLDQIPSSTWESDQAPISTQELASPPTLRQQKVHMRFGSEEPIDMSAHNANKGEEVQLGTRKTSWRDAPDVQTQNDDDGSDSDEAPEMVATAAAASKAKAAEEELARAKKVQQEREARRKQQRAARVAEEQAEKRKREENKARKLAKTQQSQRRYASPSAALGVDINNLPALLPDSLLEAAGDRRPPTPPPVRRKNTEADIRQEKLSRHTKFLEQSEKPFKDVKKGSLSVSVLAQQNMLLAPKANRNTKNIREHWLKGRQVEKRDKKGRLRVEKTKIERRSVARGFLRNED